MKSNSTYRQKVHIYLAHPIDWFIEKTKIKKIERREIEKKR